MDKKDLQFMNFRNQPPDKGRGDIALIVIIIAGLLIGFMLKRVHIGLLIGIVLGLLASVLLRRKR